MTAARTLTDADVEEVIRVLGIGRCSPARHAEVGCSTCDAKVNAIATVRAMAAEIVRLREAVALAAELIPMGHDHDCIATYGPYRCRCDSESRASWRKEYAPKEGGR